MIRNLISAAILRNNPATRPIKIVAVTSTAMPGDRDRIMGQGAEAYLAKTLDIMELPNIGKRLF